MGFIGAIASSIKTIVMISLGMVKKLEWSIAVKINILGQDSAKG